MVKIICKLCGKGIFPGGKAVSDSNPEVHARCLSADDLVEATADTKAELNVITEKLDIYTLALKNTLPDNITETSRLKSIVDSLRQKIAAFTKT